MKTRSFFALMLGMLLVLGACNENKKQEPIEYDKSSGNPKQEQNKTTLDTDGAISGHEYVNLGLPSGTLWASCNVGADSPEEYGDYFAWGETRPKSIYVWSTYKYGTYDNNNKDKLTKYCDKSSDGLNGYTDNKKVLAPEDDAATANWGSNWRMPTESEMLELYKNCKIVSATQSGKMGTLFTGPNGNTMFLPYMVAQGGVVSDVMYFFRSSSLGSDSPFGARGIVTTVYGGLSVSSWQDINRDYGLPVRPVVVANPDPNAPYLSLDVVWRSFGGAGGEFTVQVYSNSAWSVSCDQPWVRFATTSGLGNGSFSVQVAASESDFIDNALIMVTVANGEAIRTVAVSRAARMPSDGTLSGHDYVNLGLPSGTLWATCNVGADFPEEYGDCFAWGETEPKTNYDWSTYRYGSDYNQLTMYCNNSDFGKNGFTDTKTILSAEDDAATVNWGLNWRMPTLSEVQELYGNCTNVWTAYGRLFTGPNGKTLLLPSSLGGSGEYWSSSLYMNNPNHAYYFYITPDAAAWYYGGERCDGKSIRSVVVR